ncbi:MAG: head-tail connector protein, partial [Aliarcobacter sp.]
MNAEELLHPLKENLVVEHDADDPLMLRCLSSAISYAEGYQKKGPDHYQSHPMTESTKQAVIVLASFFYESRDGSTAGFFSDSPDAVKQVWETV